MPTNQMRALP